MFSYYVFHTSSPVKINVTFILKHHQAISLADCPNSIIDLKNTLFFEKLKYDHIVKRTLGIEQTNDSTENFCEVCKHKINGFQS